MTEENEPMGSVAEEAAKLLDALQDWAKESATSDGGATTAGASSVFRSINEHIATGGQECRYCPVCQLISAMREVSPEVKQHLSSAAASLVQALRAVIVADTGEPPQRTEDSIEKIEVTDDAWDE